MWNSTLTELIQSWPFDAKEKELWLKFIVRLPEKFSSYVQLLLQKRQVDLIKLEKQYIEKIRKVTKK